MTLGGFLISVFSEYITMGIVWTYVSTSTNFDQ